MIILMMRMIVIIVMISPAAMGRLRIENIAHPSVRKHADDNFKCHQ